MIYIKIIRYIINYFDFFQQKKIINFLSKRISDQIIFFDIGSHHGETIFLFKKHFNIEQFHCFEPSFENFKKLKENIIRKKLNNLCILNNLAAGNENKKSFFYQIKESSSSTIQKINFNSKYLKRKLNFLNIGSMDEFYKTETIQICRLDDYLCKNLIKQITVLKIDTEGHEKKVLEGLNDSIKKIKFIYFEHHYDDMIIKDYKFRDIHNYLSSFNFKQVYKSKMFFRKSFEYIYENQ